MTIRDPDPARDRALALRAARGDREAAEALVDRFRCVPRILHALNRRSSDPLPDADVSDVVQEVMTSAWRRLGEFHGESVLEAWLYRFCVLSLKAGRRRTFGGRTGDVPEADLVDALPAPGQALDEAERAAAIEASLARLSDEESRVIRMRLYDELGFDEIAGRLGMTTSGIKARYYRGLERLRERLAGLREMGRA